MALKIDIIEGHSVIEEFGYITELVRRARVKGIFATLSGRVLGALDAVGLPVPGDAHPDDDTLILGQRIPMADSPGSWDSFFVDLVYRTRRIILRGGTQVSQITTQTNTDGTPITITYSNAEAEGGTSPQVVEITPFNAETVVYAELLDQADFPADYVGVLVNKLNSSTWKGVAAGRALCTSGNFEPYALTAATPWYKFTFEIQIRDLREPFNNAWNPEIAWVSPETGELAADPDYATSDGARRVLWYDTVDFNTVLS